jgi:hypothetical protein
MAVLSGIPANACNLSERGFMNYQLDKPDNLLEFSVRQVKDTAVLTARFADLRMLTSIMS